MAQLQILESQLGENLGENSVKRTESVFAPFSHIFVEEEILEHEVSQRLVRRFKKAQIVVIKHYKEVFNRPRQNWRIQKQSQNLILAKRTKNFLYPAPTQVIQTKGEVPSFYTTIAQNCLYDCDYCFLQGLYPTANLLIFVNQSDFFSAVKEQATKGPFTLSLSYETDLMALEHLHPIASEWVNFAKEIPLVTFEIRTKSRARTFIETVKPQPNVLLSWTLSPKLIAKQYERGAATTEMRIKSVVEAQNRGWRVRLCFDPILKVDNWKEQYLELIEECFQVINPDKVEDLTIGTFRMAKSQLKKIREQRQDSTILFDNVEVMKSDKGQIVSYTKETNGELIYEVRNLLAKHILNDKILAI